MSLNHLVASQS